MPQDLSAQELQSLRNLGNEAERAADTIEAQAAEIARLQAALQRIVSVMGPTVPECCGCAYEWGLALRDAQIAIGAAREST